MLEVVFRMSCVTDLNQGLCSMVTDLKVFYSFAYTC